MVTKYKNLHCGACMTNFYDTTTLNAHIETCPAARVLLPFIGLVWSGNDQMGHPLSHFIQALHINAHLIKSYAYCVADEMPGAHRSEIHAKLCEKLGVEYHQFIPFETNDLDHLPNRDEAEKILWDGIQKILLKKSKKS